MEAKANLFSLRNQNQYYYYCQCDQVTDVVTVKDASSEIVYRLGKLSKIDISRLDKNSFKNTKTIKTYEGKKTLKHFCGHQIYFISVE